MNLFLFPSITVFYSFCSFKCLFASDCSHSSYKRFHSPGPTAGSCCPHPNLQDLTNLELQRGLAIWQGLPCCSQHLLLEIAGCWAESFLCTRLALVLASQDNQYRAQSCRWMYPGAPPLDSAGTAPAGLSLGAQKFGSCLCLSPASCFMGTVIWPMPAARAPFGMAGVPEVGQSCCPVMAPVCKQHLQLWPILGAG